jgi:hypothetical protein
MCEINLWLIFKEIFLYIIYETCDIEDEIDESHVNLEIDFVALGVIKP